MMIHTFMSQRRPTRERVLRGGRLAASLALAGSLNIGLLRSVAADTPQPVAATAPMATPNAASNATRTADSGTPKVGVPRAECFPLETLSDEIRPRAEKLLLKLLDSEALYSVVGGMKPMSSGFGSYYLQVAKPDTTSMEQSQQILATFRCGTAIHAGIVPFHSVFGGRRYLEAAIFCDSAFTRAVAAYPEFWKPYGITPRTDPLTAVVMVENDPTSARNRGLGYMYGYPKYAVDFFVASEDESAKTKKLVPRTFRQIPTFVSATGKFVYAVPKDQPENDEDRALKEKAGRILAAYWERRERYIGNGKPGVVALLRDWFEDGTGHCDPANARF